MLLQVFLKAQPTIPRLVAAATVTTRQVTAQLAVLRAIQLSKGDISRSTMVVTLTELMKAFLWIISRNVLIIQTISIKNKPVRLNKRLSKS